MRSTLASWAAVSLIACSGSEFGSTPGRSGIGGAGGTSDGAGGTSAGAGGQTGVSGGAGGNVGGGGRAAGGGSGALASGGARATGGTTSSGTGGTTSVGTGGTTSSGTGGTTSSGTGGGVGVADAGPPRITACGVAPPDPAAKCSGTFACTYGTDPRPGCRSSYQCVGGAFLVGLPKCPAVKSCYADVSPLPVIGKACDPPGDFCVWDGGLACSCAACTGTSCTDKYTWNCAPAASTPCPPVAPNQGQACDDSAPSSCTYGACGVQSYVIARCKQKIWNLEIPPCN